MQGDYHVACFYTQVKQNTSNCKPLIASVRRKVRRVASLGTCNSGALACNETVRCSGLYWLSHTVTGG